MLKPMKREIKFRGLDFDGIWRFGNLVVVAADFGNGVIENTCYISSGQEAKKPPFICAVMPQTVGQFTGDKDINGVEVYEDDIAKLTWSNQPALLPMPGQESQEVMTYTELGIMQYNEKALQFGFLLENSLFQDHFEKLKCEVVGNVHQNASLFRKDR